MSVPGWYGKLPGLGDFASRRLPAGFVQSWDAWLQQGLAAAREQWGTAWLERYLVAPILRFWVDAGVVDGGPWMGLVMPSVDRVGRHFPLTVAQPAGPLVQALSASEWFDATDAAMRKVLDVSFTVDDFERELQALHSAGEGTKELPLSLEGEGGGEGAHHTAWWEQRAVQRPHTFAALPPPNTFAKMFGGNA